MRIGISLVLLTALLFAEVSVDKEIKHTLRTNMMHTYDLYPPEVESLEDMFTQSMFYGRLRFNSFGFKWKEEIQTDSGIKIRADHAIAAAGGSLIYKTAYLHGFSLGAGVYVTAASGTLERSEAYLYKAGKGAFSRYDKLMDDKNGIISLAQAYLEQ